MCTAIMSSNVAQLLAIQRCIKAEGVKKTNQVDKGKKTKPINQRVNKNSSKRRMGQRWGPAVAEQHTQQLLHKVQSPGPGVCSHMVCITQAKVSVPGWSLPSWLAFL